MISFFTRTILKVYLKMYTPCIYFNIHFKNRMQNLEGFSYANPQCFSTLKEKTQPYVGGKGQLFTVDYVPMVPLLSGKPTFKSAISLFYPRLRLASFVPMGLHSPASLPKAYKWKENCPRHF